MISGRGCKAAAWNQEPEPPAKGLGHAKHGARVRRSFARGWGRVGCDDVEDGPLEEVVEEACAHEQLGQIHLVTERVRAALR